MTPDHISRLSESRADSRTDRRGGNSRTTLGRGPGRPEPPATRNGLTSVNFPLGGYRSSMKPTRVLARPMLASVFIASGIDVLRNPQPRVAKAEAVAPQLAKKAGLPQDTELLLKINAATHIVAGTMMGLGKCRRLSALALMGSLVPTTYVDHRFWEITDPAERADQRTHFLKNVALMGGLLLEAVDTEGRPSLTWRSQRAARRALKAASVGGATAKGSGRSASLAAKGVAATGATQLAEAAVRARAAAEAVDPAATTQAVRESLGRALDSDAAHEMASWARDLRGNAATLIDADTAREFAIRAGKARDGALRALDGDTARELANRAQDLRDSAVSLMDSEAARELAAKAAKARMVTEGAARALRSDAATELAATAAKAKVLKEGAARALHSEAAGDLLATAGKAKILMEGAARALDSDRAKALAGSASRAKAMTESAVKVIDLTAAKDGLTRVAVALPVGHR